MPITSRDKSKAAKAAKKEIPVIDMGGAKTVQRKASWVKTVNVIFLIISVIWLGLVYWFPMHVKNTYAEPIKKSIVVSMFFDMQRNLEEQYSKLLKGIANSIDLEKPIAKAVQSVKLASSSTAKVQKATGEASGAVKTASGISNLAGKFGVKAKGVDDAIGGAGKAINKADDVATQVNQQLDKVTVQLQKTAQIEIDKELDTQIKSYLDKKTGLGSTMLTNYGVKHIYPWRPSTWPVATKIYNDLEKSSVQIIQSLTSTVDKYFGYVAWGLVVAAWAIGLIIWFIIRSKVRDMTRPFIVCPRCGHTFADKRTWFMFLKVLQPWKWF